MTTMQNHEKPPLLPLFPNAEQNHMETETPSPTTLVHTHPRVGLGTLVDLGNVSLYAQYQRVSRKT